MKKKAKRVSRPLTPTEKARLKRNQKLVEQDLPELMALGRKFKARQQSTVQAIVDELQEAKEQAGVSLAELEGRTGINRTALSRFFNRNSNPTVLTLNKVATALGRRLVVSLEKERTS
ncbi:MAG: helix-turn-helix transcriptional regulator [Planctomycetaceae bacterium]|nr:helix-turn-helix transcriptional regulator [Planctomycetaceae bacterium]MCB9952851.1 helix-turn-helix transcriptional regulator [Planctomycetaceae bacterium]